MTSMTVAVIGAGPAGCAAAITLAKHGIPVTLFERGQPGKDKPCGDAWLPDALDHMSALGVPLDTLSNGTAKPFSQIDLWDATRPIWTISLEGQTGWIAPRATIDQALRDTAASTSDLRYGTSVLALDQTQSGWQLTFKTAAEVKGAEQFPAVILATGAANSFSRHVGIAGNPMTGASISVYGHLPGINAPLFQFSPLGVPGYGWVFPLADDRVNIGVCAATMTPATLRSATQHYLEQWHPHDVGPFRAGAGPMWSNEGTQWHENHGLLSCGDAAGLVDPLTGEGIAAALESGTQAALAIQRFLIEGDAHALPGYSHWVQSTFQRRYAPTPSRRLWRYLNNASQEPHAAPRLSP